MRMIEIYSYWLYSNPNSPGNMISTIRFMQFSISGSADRNYLSSTHLPSTWRGLPGLWPVLFTGCQIVLDACEASMLCVTKPPLRLDETMVVS